MDDMPTVERHGVSVSFPDLPGATETPYVYEPFTRGDWYEERFLEHIRTRGRSGVYVDVGAHLGTHTAWFALMCPSTHVHAVEPVSRFADQLQRLIEANRLVDKVTVHRVGVADAPGTATNRLSREHQVGFQAAGAAETVDETFSVTTLDDLIDGPVSVIKIDVERMESKVLLGARRILTTSRPLVYAEAHDRDQLAEITAVLDQLDYVATGRVFNASPTHEFAPADGAAKGGAIQSAAISVRRRIWRGRYHLEGAARSAARRLRR